MTTSRKLVWRLYLLGFLQLVLLGATVAGVGYLLRPVRSQPEGPHGGPGGGPPPPGDGPHPHGEPPGYAEPPAPPRGGPPAPPRGGPPGPPSPVGPLLTFLVSGLAIVGAGSFLTARWIVRPLQKLSQTARALGAGDLRARASMTRLDEIGEVGRAFDEMADRVEALLAAERELLANVSHELRTPLARIRVALDLVSEAGPESDRPTISEINLDLSEIEALIDDILTTTRLEVEGARPRRPDSSGSSGLPLHLEPVSPAVLCEGAAQRFRAGHPDRELRVETDDRLPDVEVDAMLLRRAIGNLLENAHKYSPESDQPIFLQARSRDTRVELAVIDRGIGIAPEDLPRVFAPFFRSDRSRSRGTGGVGLGLTLTKRIVEAHGGTIDVTSGAGVGTSVRIVLDAAPPPATLEKHDLAHG